MTVFLKSCINPQTFLFLKLKKKKKTILRVPKKFTKIKASIDTYIHTYIHNWSLQPIQSGLLGPSSLCANRNYYPKIIFQVS